MKASFANVARAMVLAACVLGVAARIPKPMVVDDLRKAITPKQTTIDGLMNAGTPKKTAIDEGFQVKAAKTQAGTSKKTAIDEDFEIKAAKTEAHTPKKTAIDEERRRSHGSSLDGKPAPTLPSHVLIADSSHPSLGYLIMRAETFDLEGIVCGGIQECDFFCKSLGFSCGKCQENPSACRCEETCY